MPAGNGVGTVVVQLDRAIPGISVMIDGETVVSGARTNRIMIEGVEPGDRRIRIDASSIILDEDLSYDRIHGVEAGGTKVIELAAPAESVIFRDTVLLLTAVAIALL